ncbi:hypothetical protein BBP40_010021 [Aspergillus hancockii]|nr:hypothetical protein BBP40_010021 [Aspergillus hancockii]
MEKNIPRQRWTQLDWVIGLPVITMIVNYQPNAPPVQYKKYMFGLNVSSGVLKTPEDSFVFVGYGSLDVYCSEDTVIRFHNSPSNSLEGTF